MLGRQGWGLIHKPNSLCGKLLKAKYFPNCGIMETAAIPEISYSWRSILKGVDLLKEGLVWRIGDGSNIKVWKDPCLPDNDTRRPKTIQGRSLVTNVADLIDLATGGWDVGLVQDNFHPDNARTILSISLCENMDDCLAWHFDPKVQFSIKSAYNLGVRL